MADQPAKPYSLLDELSGASAPPPPPAPTGVSAKDLLKQFGGAVAQQVGGAAYGVGKAVDEATNNSTLGSGIKKAGQQITGGGNRLQDTATQSAKEALANTTPTGTITDPGTWSLGKDPSLGGAAMQAAGFIGQAAPTIATAALTHGKGLLPTAAVGGASMGGMAAQQEEQRITEMTPDDLAKVPGYQQRLAQGMTPDQARADLSQAAGTGAFRWAAPVGALSALTEGLPITEAGQSALAKVVGTSRLARAGSGALLAGTSGAVQGAGFGAAQTYGANQATGETRDPGEGALSMAVLGGVGGATAGAAGGAFRRLAEHPGTTDPNESATGTPAAPVTTTSATPEAPGTADAAANAGPTVREPKTPEQIAARAQEIAAGKPIPPSDPIAHAPAIVEGGVRVDPDDGPMSRALAQGINEGVVDSHPEQTRALTEAQQRDGDEQAAAQQAQLEQQQEQQRQAEEAANQPPKSMTPDELDQALAPIIARTPVMDSTVTDALARRFGVERAEIVEAKKRVRSATQGADVANALDEAEAASHDPEANHQAAADAAKDAGVEAPALDRIVRDDGEPFATVPQANRMLKTLGNPEKYEVTKVGNGKFEIRPKATDAAGAATTQERSNGNEQKSTAADQGGPQAGGAGDAQQRQAEGPGSGQQENLALPTAAENAGAQPGSDGRPKPVATEPRTVDSGQQPGGGDDVGTAGKPDEPARGRSADDAGTGRAEVPAENRPAPLGTVDEQAAGHADEAGQGLVSRDAAAGGETPGDRVRNAKPLHEMSHDELEQHRTDIQQHYTDVENEVMSPADAKSWRASQGDSDAAYARREAIEAKYPREAMERVYGMGDSERFADDTHLFQQAHTDANAWTSREDAASVLGRQMRELSHVQGTDLAKWTTQQQAAAVTMRQLGAEIKARGEDANAIKTLALTKEAARYSDPNDASDMLKRWFDIAANSRAKAEADTAAPKALTGPGGVERRSRESLEARIAELEKERATDKLTGLGNRTAFDEDAGFGKAVGAMDMDGLKKLNDAVGHEAADKVMQHIGATLAKYAGDDARFYRRSGDEFAARFTDDKSGRELLAKIQDELDATTVTLEAVDADGNHRTYEYDGIGLSVGVGDSYESADAGANANKSERLASGKREQPRADGTPQRLRDTTAPRDEGAGREDRQASPEVAARTEADAYIDGLDAADAEQWAKDIGIHDKGMTDPEVREALKNEPIEDILAERDQGQLAEAAAAPAVEAPAPEPPAVEKPAKTKRAPKAKAEAPAAPDLTLGGDVQAKPGTDIADVGEKIGGARKDLWSGRSLSLDDVGKLDDIDLQTLVKKNQVWRDPDYQQMARDYTAEFNKLAVEGTSPEDIGQIANATVHAVKAVRDSIDQPDPKWTREKFQEYVKGVGLVRDAMAQLRFPRDMLGYSKMLEKVFGEDIVRKAPNGRAAGLNTESANYKAMSALGSRFLKTIQKPETEWLRTARTKELPGAGEPAYRKGIDIRPTSDGQFEAIRRLGGRRIGEIMPTADGVEAMLKVKHTDDLLKKKFGVGKDNDGYVVYRRNADGTTTKLVTGLKTLEDGINHLRMNADSLLAGGKNEFRRPQLARIEREGPALRDGNADAEGFRNQYGFRGVEFGNWTDQKDRQAYVNYAYDALGDLSRALELPPKAMALDGQLALAFGSRGKGGALAHYEPLRKVINLTKMNGAGALAHEWGHAFDNYMAGGSKFLSDTGKLPPGMRPELMDAYRKVIDTMLSREVERPHDIEMQQKRVERNVNDVDGTLRSLREMLARNDSDLSSMRKPANEGQLALFDDIANRIRTMTEADQEKGIEGRRILYKPVRELMNLFKQVKGRASLVPEHFNGDVGSIVFAKEAMAKAIEERTQIVKTATDYLAAAKKEDEMRKKPYWSSKLEMFARAFESYVEDKVRGEGGQSDYLVNGTGGRVYPGGDERTAINGAFDHLFKTLNSETTDRGTVRLFFKGGKEVEAAAARGVDDGQVAAIQKVVDDTAASWKEANRPEVQLVRTAADLPEDIRATPGFDPTVGAVHDNGRIFLVADRLGTPERAQAVLAHEAVGHYAVEQIMGKDAFRSVRDSIVNLRDRGAMKPLFDELRTRYGDLPPGELASEAMGLMAEKGMRNTLFGRMLAATRAFLRDTLGMKLAFNEGDLRKIIQNAGTWLKSGRAPEARAEEARPASFAKLDPNTTVDNIESAIQQRSGPLPERITEAFRGKWTDAKQHGLLGALTLRQLAEVSGQKSVKDYHQEVTAMSARRNELMEQVSDVSKRWEKWQKANRGEKADALTTLMHESTLAGVDGAEGYQQGTTTLYNDKVIPHTKVAVEKAIAELKMEQKDATGIHKQVIGEDIGRLTGAAEREAERKAAYPAMKAKFDALPKAAQDLYREVRDQYTQRAEDTLKALIQRIDGLDSLPQADRDAMVSAMRARFESSKVEAPYFPLARFGKYWVAAERPGTSGLPGDVQRQFRMVENAAQHQRAIKAYEQAGWKVKAGHDIDKARAIDGVSSQFIASITDTLTRNGVDGKVADDIYQLYLKSLPDLSARKNFIHRKGTAGYSGDALRAFASNMFHGSYQLARLEHSNKLEAHLANLQKDTEALADAGQHEQSVKNAGLINELKKRHEWVMSPKDSGALQKVMGANFVYYLGAAPASAIVNLTQGYITTFPALAAKHGWGRALGEITKALGQSIRTYGDINKTLTSAGEKKAFAELTKMGAIDRTLTHDLAGLGDGDTKNYNPAFNRVMGVVSHLFHKSEVFNREAAGMAAYRLGIADGMSHETAVKHAADTIFDTHGDYSNVNRARFMQSNGAKVILAFRQYSQLLTYNLWRSFHQATKGETPEVRTQARKQLMGTLGMTALFSGAMGLPMMSMLMGTANAAHSLFGNQDEPFDAETEFKNFLAEHLGATGASIAANGVANHVLGGDIGSRTQLNDLWFRGPDRELEGKDLSDYWLEQLAGPVGQMAITNPIKAFQLVQQGNLMRGIETLMPSGIKNPLKTLRYGMDGVKNLRGEELVKDVTPFELAMQTAGFTPTRIAEQYDANNAMQNYQQAITDRRKTVMDAYALALSTKDPVATRKAAADIDHFNRTNPELGITANTIRRALQARAKYDQRAVNGLVLNKKLEQKVRGAVSFDDDDDAADSADTDDNDQG